MDESSVDGRSAIEQCEALMSQWRAERNSVNFNPVNLLDSLSDLLEDQVNIFYSTDPDPFDDRHPLRTDSSCELGQLLRLLSTHESFLERITFVYLIGSDEPSDRLVVAASRLLCAMRLGVTLSFTLDEEDLTINTLYKLASTSYEPTNCYALFLLGSLLDNTELLYTTRQKNMQLVPIVVERLQRYAEQLQHEMSSAAPAPPNAGMDNLLGSFHLKNLTTEMKIRLSIAYLSPLADYQDLMPFMYNSGILQLIYVFISSAAATRDIRLTFEALRLLSNLMCHRCVYLDFVESNGLQAVLKVPRPSVAATAVSVVLYYTAYFEDAMERVCQLPADTLAELIRYSLWLVECSHPSARCYSLFFLNLVLCYGVTFRLFEANNGLVYLYNAICVLPLRLTEDNPSTSKDTTSWHVVRASLCAIRRFLEISLLLWLDSVDPSLANIFDEPPRAVVVAGFRRITYTPEQLSRLIVLIVSRIRPEIVWQPTQQLRECGAIGVIYRIIARNVYVHNSWPCRNECTRLAVDILNLMSLTYDLADEIANAEVYSFPPESVAFMESTPLFSSLVTARVGAGGGGGSDTDESGGSPNSTDITVHLPSPANGGGDGAAEARSERRGGLLSQLMEIVEQVSDSLVSNSGGGGVVSGRRHAASHTGRIPSIPAPRRSDDNPLQPLRSRMTHSSSASDLMRTTSTYRGNTRMVGRGGQRIQVHSRLSHSDNEEQDSLGIADGGSAPIASSNDERINGLHMLFSISREDDGWDVAVHKAVLSFICTLVYRPIAEHEHPDNPIRAASVMSLPSSPSSVALSGFMCPLSTSRPTANSLASTSVTASGSQLAVFKSPYRSPNTLGSALRVNRKRRLDESPRSLFTSSTAAFGGGRSAFPSVPPNSPFSASEISAEVYGGQEVTGGQASHQQLLLLHRQIQLWNVVRRQHGLMALLCHLETKQPISEADSVRTLACRGLVGLARSEEVRGMLTKMPLFTKALLQLLMKEPILPDRLSEHAEFCRYATMLIRLVVGNLTDGMLCGDMSLERVRRAEIVAKTRIQWDQEELLELIFRHLQSKGLHNTAATLQAEARLKVYQSGPNQILPLYDDFSRAPGETPPYRPSVGNDMFSPDTRLLHLENNVSNSVNESNTTVTAANASGDTTAAGPLLLPLRVTKIRPSTTSTQTPKPCRDRFERPGIPNLYLKPVSSQQATEMTLSKVVESFLLQQHAQCPHPVSVCPKFSLYHPHRCPEPQLKRQSNGCHRLFTRDSLYGSLRLRPSRREDRHFLHRRFQPTAVIREAEDDLLTACCFSLTDDGLFLGTTSGAIAWVNVEEDDLPVELFHVQTSSIRRLAHTRDGSRLLVCSEWSEPATIVAPLRQTASSTNGSPWEAGSEEVMLRISEARYAEFSNTGQQDRLVATYGKMAKVFDLATGVPIADLFSAVKQSGYMLNKATFSPTDQQVLNDGLIWDLRCMGLTSGSDLRSSYSYRPVHKLDTLQDIVSGVFHPNGLEIIVGSAVWDVRTWRLLHTIQALDRLEVQFNATQDVIYAGTFGLDDVEYADMMSNSRLAVQNMFRTVDALDYSLIASVDVRHRIEQLALDTTGQSLALVESIGDANNNANSNEPETQCRIYMVGKKRGEREVDNDDEEGRDEDDDDDDDDDDDEEDNDEDDDDLMNVETADELAEILDASSGDDDSDSSNWTSSTSTGLRSSSSLSSSPPSSPSSSSVDGPITRRGSLRRSRRLRARQVNNTAVVVDTTTGSRHESTESRPEADAVEGAPSWPAGNDEDMRRAEDSPSSPGNS